MGAEREPYGVTYSVTPAGHRMLVDHARLALDEAHRLHAERVALRDRFTSGEIELDDDDLARVVLRVLVAEERIRRAAADLARARERARL